MEESSAGDESVHASDSEPELEANLPVATRSESDSVEAPATGTQFRAIAISVITVALLVGSLAFLKYAKSDSSPASDQSPIKTLAVLPFKPLTDEGADPSLQ